jgi:hypothetical protein
MKKDLFDLDNNITKIFDEAIKNNVVLLTVNTGAKLKLSILDLDTGILTIEQ